MFVGDQVIFQSNELEEEDYPNELDEDYPRVGYGVCQTAPGLVTELMVTPSRETLARSSNFKVSVTNPGEIDLTTIFQGGAYALYTKGIYAIEGDVLTYCIARPGELRPSEFVTREGDHLTMVVLRRVP